MILCENMADSLSTNIPCCLCFMLGHPGTVDKTFRNANQFSLALIVSLTFRTALEWCFGSFSLKTLCFSPFFPFIMWATITQNSPKILWEETTAKFLLWSSQPLYLGNVSLPQISCFCRLCSQDSFATSCYRNRKKNCLKLQRSIRLVTENTANS